MLFDVTEKRTLSVRLRVQLLLTGILTPSPSSDYRRLFLIQPAVPRRSTFNRTYQLANL